MMPGQPAEVARVEERVADDRWRAIMEDLGNPAKGMSFHDEFTTGEQSSYVYATIFYPLWSGLATKEQAAAVDSHLALLDRPGGLATSTTSTGLQWDLPFGWAPLNWLAVDGMKKYGYVDDARKVAGEFSNTILKSFKKEGTIHEKYNVETESSTWS